MCIIVELAQARIRFSEQGRFPTAASCRFPLALLLIGQGIDEIVIRKECPVIEIFLLDSAIR